MTENLSGLTTDPTIRPDLIDIMGALLAINRSLIAITKGLPELSERKEVIEGIETLNERLDQILQRWGAPL